MDAIKWLNTNLARLNAHLDVKFILLDIRHANIDARLDLIVLKEPTGL